MEGGGAMGMGSAGSASKGMTDRVSWSIWPMEDDWNSSSHPDDPSSHHHQHLPAIPPAFDSYAATGNHHGILAPIAAFPHGHGEAHHHLTCLKLGKRQYFEKPLAGGARKERAVGGTSSAPVAPTAAPRCQVEGCNAGLADAKEYHKRHKVCEAHSKSPKVVVLGLEQRFCQQCSRFHVLSEFDDAKRSCRRRLAGHNERRRKSSNESMIRNPALGSTDS